MKDVLIWIAFVSVGIAILVALIPLIPFLIGVAAVVLIWWSLGRLLAYLFDARPRR